MRADEIKGVLERVLTWPPDLQREAMEMLLYMEAAKGELYHPTDEEWAAIQEGLDQVNRGEFATDEEMTEVWRRFGL